MLLIRYKLTETGKATTGKFFETAAWYPKFVSCKKIMTKLNYLCYYTQIQNILCK